MQKFDCHARLHGIILMLFCLASLSPTLLAVDSSLSVLRTVTCVFLYTYPTLLQALVPLLEHLITHYNVKRVVTLTYHLEDRIGAVAESNKEFDFRLYKQIRQHHG